MTDTVRNLVIGGIVVTLFMFLLITFSIQGGVEYGKDTAELSGSKLNYTQINTTLEQAQTNAETWQDIFESQSFISIGTGILLVKGMFGLMKTMWNFAVTPFKMFFAVMNNVLHIPPIMTSISLVILVVLFIFGVWQLLKTGS